MIKIIGLFFFACFMWSGSGPDIVWAIGSAPDRLKPAQEEAKGSGMSEIHPDTGLFRLQSWTRFTFSPTLRVYIEGDGFAWFTFSRPSWDPTPKHRLVLGLAGQDSAVSVAYLARPCQYLGINDNENCSERYWTDARFSEEVVASMNEAVDQLKKSAGAETIELVGYSGGAAVAVLIAARRNDIASIRTIAGNLDPQGLNKHHNASPLNGSLDPMEAAKKVSSIPQRHFVGSADKVVPGFVSQNYLRASGNPACVAITSVEGATHRDGWAERWEELLEMPVSCRQRT